jgi:GNAT superfamily N-acetyltransferase
LLRAWIEPHLSNAAWRVLLGVVDGEPAGVLTATLTNGRAGPAVGLKGLGVLPEVRGRGVATALVTAALDIGAAHGVTLAHAYPDPEEVPLFDALGFEEVDGFEVRLMGDPPSSPERPN